MSNSDNLRKANTVKDDEFYTRREDINAELRHYKQHFEGKTVFLNCDDPVGSNFFWYFRMQFHFLKLKRLVATHYVGSGEPSYKIELLPHTVNDSGEFNRDEVTTPLKGNGDFRSPECIELLKQSDIVVTNPPFSLFREYIAQLTRHGKQFLIIGSENAISYKEFFPLLRDNKVWMGYTKPKVFARPDGTAKKFGNITWFTNLDIEKRHEKLTLYRAYNPKDYPKYDNLDAIEVSKATDIPEDYDGWMGVPISFLNKYSPDQFEIVGSDDELNKKLPGMHRQRAVVNGKAKYARIIIAKKKKKETNL